MTMNINMNMNLNMNMNMNRNIEMDTDMFEKKNYLHRISDCNDVGFVQKSESTRISL